MARTSALVTMPSSAAPSTNIGVLTRFVLTRRISGSMREARTASGCTRAAHDSTISSGVCALKRCSRTSGVVPMKPVRLPTGSERMEIHGWRRPDPRRQPEHALRRHRCHQDRRRGIVVLQVSLHDEAAQRMRDEDRAAAEALGGGAHVVDIVGDRARVERLVGRAAAVAAQTHRHRAVAGRRRSSPRSCPSTRRNANRRGRTAAAPDARRRRIPCRSPRACVRSITQLGLGRRV